MGRCFLIGAGDLTVGELAVKEEDFVIALDGGLGYCGLLQVEPDLIIGDFDSVTDGERAAVEKLELEIPEKIIRLKPEKDDTDMLYGIKHALRLGYRDFRLYGATGGRLEHTLANIQCLLYLKDHDAVGYLMDGNGMIMVLRNEEVRFRPNMEGYISLFSLDREARGVTIRGLKYELEDACITNTFPIGVSNEFTGQEAKVSVKDGELVCIISYPADV